MATEKASTKCLYRKGENGLEQREKRMSVEKMLLCPLFEQLFRLMTQTLSLSVDSPVGAAATQPFQWMSHANCPEETVAFPARRQLLPSGLMTDGTTSVHADEYKRANKPFLARALTCPSIHLNI
ncbi:hypothetical protein PAMP_016236 [Pampus punctatissimus]